MLESQLESATREFLGNSEKGMRFEPLKSTLHLSSIFKWYGKDFISKFTPAAGFKGLNKTERAMLNFHSRYLSATDRKYLAKGGYSVKYLGYNWSLNNRKVKK